jgi:hypothetical protein
MTKHILLAVTIVAVFAAPAYAQNQFGVRAGVSADPDQFFFGGHFETDPIVDRLTFRPNVEIGLGDDVTLAAFNIEFVYSVPLSGHPWRVYFGGGPALNLYDGDAEGGFNLLVGLQHRGGLLTEFKVGMIDSPSVKFAVGSDDRSPDGLSTTERHRLRRGVPAIPEGSAPGRTGRPCADAGNRPERRRPGDRV